MNGSVGTLLHSTCRSNHAALNGGAVVVRGGGDLELTNASFDSNHAANGTDRDDVVAYGVSVDARGAVHCDDAHCLSFCTTCRCVADCFSSSSPSPSPYHAGLASVRRSEPPV